MKEGAWTMVDEVLGVVEEGAEVTLDRRSQVIALEDGFLSDDKRYSQDSEVMYLQCSSQVVKFH